MFVKICGVTRPEDAVAAACAGADAIGLNFVPTSPRCVSVEAAAAIVDVVTRPLMVVGVFRDQPFEEIIDTVGTLRLDGAQLHGDETPSETARVAKAVGLLIKAVDMRAPADLLAAYRAQVLLLDGPAPGSGKPFNWGAVGRFVGQYRILLAGGLDVHNVADAVRQVRPWGVDVASGVETAPGLKDLAAMTTFASRARLAR